MPKKRKSSRQEFAFCRFPSAATIVALVEARIPLCWMRHDDRGRVDPIWQNHCMYLLIFAVCPEQLLWAEFYRCR